MTTKARGRRAGTRVLDGRLYDVYRLEPGVEAQAVALRTHPRQNSFDQSYMKGRFPMWVRHQGTEPALEADEKLVWDNQPGLYNRERPVGYNRPRAEEPYVQALAEFFDDRIALMPPKPRQLLSNVKDWLHRVMYDGRSQEEQGKELGITQQAVSVAQKRAVDQLIESCGGKAKLAESLRQFLHDKEQADGQDRLKYLPRWVHG
jgi:hypothetical protein